MNPELNQKIVAASREILSTLSRAVLELRHRKKKTLADTIHGAHTVLEMAFECLDDAWEEAEGAGTTPELRRALQDTFSTVEKVSREAGIAAARSDDLLVKEILAKAANQAQEWLALLRPVVEFASRPTQASEF